MAGEIVLTTSGEYSIDYVSDTASHDLNLDLISPTLVSVCIDCAHIGTWGPEVLGSFVAGTELVFRLTDTTSLGTGPWLNTDVANAVVTNPSANTWRISWEDSGGDGDLNDLVVEITKTGDYSPTVGLGIPTGVEVATFTHTLVSR